MHMNSRASPSRWDGPADGRGHHGITSEKSSTLTLFVIPIRMLAALLAAMTTTLLLLAGLVLPAAALLVLTALTRARIALLMLRILLLRVLRVIGHRFLLEG